MNTNQKEVLTVREIEQELRIGRNKVMDLLTSGQIKSIRAGRRWLIPVWALDEYLRGAS